MVDELCPVCGNEDCDCHDAEPELYACKVCEDFYPEDELEDGTCDGCLEADHQRVESHSSVFL